MKILVIRLSSLGDIVLSQAVTGELKRIYPQCELHYLCKPQFAPIVKHFGTVDKIISYQKSLHFHKSMCLEHYDLIIDLHLKFASILLSLITPHTRLLRYCKQRGLRQRIVQTHAHSGIRSTVDLYAAVLSKLPGYMAPEEVLLPRLQVPALDPPLPQGKTLIAIFPGAAHQTKLYPVGQLAAMIKQFVQESTHSSSYHFIILGSASESYLGAELVKSAPAQVSNLCGKFNLEELIAVIDRMSLVISNDSGPMHIAAALSKPQIAIFGATHPSLGFAPQNPLAKVLVADLDCQPCSLHGGERCPRGDFRCMKAISPEIMLEALTSSLFQHREKQST